MSLFGRLKTAIKGNPVLKEHDIGKHVASAGPSLLWKVYEGVKKSTQQEVSIFIFNKHSPEIEKLPKDHREELFEMLKRGPALLAKLRHPKVLTLHHTVEESSDCIAFATEPVFASLANVLGHYENLPSPLPLSMKEFQLHTVEAHYGILQVAEALGFLHNDVKLIHGNLSPENVMINKKGEWKLTGFSFASYDNYQASTQTTFKFKEFNAQRGFSTNPQLDYLAPEYIMSGSYDTRSDLYSFGMLTYALYNGGKPLYENHNNTLTFQRSAEQISRITESSLGDTPPLLRPLIRELLAIEPSVRPDALQITKHAYFEDIMVSTLKYLDSLYSKSDMEKSQWFKSVLGKVVIRLPKRVVHQKVVSALVREFRNHKMIPFVLPIMLLIADDCTMHEYSSLILPALIPVFKIHNPIQIPLIILQKMDLILKKTSPDEMKQYILPMILATLESDNGQVQELCVSILPSFAEMIDYTSMKHSIVPRITSLSISTPSVGLAVKCLVTLGQIVHTLDKQIVLEQVIPVIVKIPSKEPGVLMGILGIFHKAMTSKNIGFDKQLIASKVLPYLIPLSVQPTLNQNQFNHFMVIIKELLKKMETEQAQYLQQVANMEEQTKSTVEFAREVSSLKASEDALRGIESLSGTERRDDNLITGKVGSGGHQTTPPTNTMVHVGDDIFAGLSAGQASGITKTTPTISSMQRLNFSESQSSSTPPTTHQLMGTWEVPRSNPTQPPSDSGLFAGMNVSNAPTTQMYGTPQASPSGGSGLLMPTNTSSFKGNQFGNTEHSNFGSGSLGADIFQPQQQSTAFVGPGTWAGDSKATLGTMTSTGTGTHGTGMGMRTGMDSEMSLLQPAQPQNSFHSSSFGMGTATPSNNLQGNTVGFNPGTDILQPTTSIARAGLSSTSSSTRMGMQPSSTGTAILQPSPVTGWSSNISEQPNPVTGWSSNVSEPAAGMGMGMNSGMSLLQPTQPQNTFHSGTSSSFGMGMATPSNNLQGNINSGWSNQGNESASAGQNTMLGWSSSLQPVNTWEGATTGQTGFGTQTGDLGSSNQQGHAVGMAPGPNPFAEFNSLI